METIKLCGKTGRYDSVCDVHRIYRTQRCIADMLLPVCIA